MFGAPPIVTTEVFTRLPDTLRRPDQHTRWSLDRGAGPLHSFLEGPAFDHAGSFYCVDLCHSRIFRVSADGQWEVFSDYDGFPNGLKIHRDGRLFVVDREYGLSAFDPGSGERSLVVGGYEGAPFVGLNDLVFADDGTIFFTDPGTSNYREPTGRVYRYAPDGRLTLIADDLAYPNGLVLSPDQQTLYVAITSAKQILRVPLTPDTQGRYRYQYSVFLQLSGGLAGPDGMAVDREGNVVIAHSGFGTIWVFSPLGEPLTRVVSCAGIRTTNVAYGGPDWRTLYITEAEHGVILRARLHTPGRTMYSHA